jgi:uncharacterized membrane protein YgcG
MAVATAYIGRGDTCYDKCNVDQVIWDVTHFDPANAEQMKDLNAINEGAGHTQLAAGFDEYIEVQRLQHTEPAGRGTWVKGMALKAAIFIRIKALASVDDRVVAPTKNKAADRVTMACGLPPTAGDQWSLVHRAGYDCIPDPAMRETAINYMFSPGMWIVYIIRKSFATHIDFWDRWHLHQRFHFSGCLFDTAHATACREHAFHLIEVYRMIFEFSPVLFSSKIALHYLTLEDLLLRLYRVVDPTWFKGGPTARELPTQAAMMIGDKTPLCYPMLTHIMRIREASTRNADPRDHQVDRGFRGGRGGRGDRGGRSGRGGRGGRGGRDNFKRPHDDDGAP